MSRWCAPPPHTHTHTYTHTHTSSPYSVVWEGGRVWKFSVRVWTSRQCMCARFQWVRAHCHCVCEHFQCVCACISVCMCTYFKVFTLNSLPYKKCRTNLPHPCSKSTTHTHTLFSQMLTKTIHSSRHGLSSAQSGGRPINWFGQLLVTDRTFYELVICWTWLYHHLRATSDKNTWILNLSLPINLK